MRQDEGFLLPQPGLQVAPSPHNILSYHIKPCVCHKQQRRQKNLENMILKHQLMILDSYFKILGLGMKNSARLGSLLLFYEWPNF